MVLGDQKTKTHRFLLVHGSTLSFSKAELSAHGGFATDFFKSIKSRHAGICSSATTRSPLVSCVLHHYSFYWYRVLQWEPVALPLIGKQ